MKMPFVFDDGGRAAAGYRGPAGDCVVRAVAIAAEQPYQAVYAALSAGSRTQRKTKRSKAKASARDGIYTRRKWFRDYMAALGWKWTPTMQIGSGCTVHLAPGELPPGRLIVSVSRHYVAVIDGAIHDTHDPRRFAFDGLTDEEKDAGVGANRCVYGYWSRTSA